MSEPAYPPIRCKKCDGYLVKRRNRYNGFEFLGCSNWPKCTYTEPIPEAWRMREMGAPLLPGIEENCGRT